MDQNLGRTALSSREGILADVDNAKAHRTKKEKKDMAQFEKFITEGNEKADELAKGGALLDTGFMAEARTETMQQEREEGARRFAVCGQLPLLGRRMEGL